MQLLDWNLEGQFVGRYLDYEPRNSFQGLPPLKDDVCEKWAKEMILTGVNLVAVCPRAGIVGHTALFPIDRSRCELLAVVWPEFQNQGIGTALTQCCMQIARQLGFEKSGCPSIRSTSGRGAFTRNAASSAARLDCPANWKWFAMSLEIPSFAPTKTLPRKGFRSRFCSTRPIRIRL